jgi:hypothetical protein
MLAAGTAGCAKDKDPTVVTANPNASKASAGTADDSGNSNLKFSQCMRDQGFAWFPDPDAQGNLKVKTPEDTDQAKYQKAQQACEKYHSSGGQNGQVSADVLDMLRKVAQCMRDHGYAKFPDPDANGRSVIDSKAIGVEEDDPAFQKAQQECQKNMSGKETS